MKKAITFILLFLTLNSFAQMSNGNKFANTEKGNSQTGTTQEEYLYMTKGFKTQEENGLDPKKGYLIKKPINIDMTNYSFEYFELIRESNNSSAGYIVKAISKVWGNTYYFGFPNNNNELLTKTFEEITKLDEAMTTSFFYSYCKLITN
jgi:hypothetical protein